MNEELSLEARCLHNNKLHYRQVDSDNPKVQYCLLGDKQCPYYRQKSQTDLCMNYTTRYK